MRRQKHRIAPQFVHILTVCVLSLTVISCGGDDDNAFGSLSGNYTGTIQDSEDEDGDETGTLQATILQTNSSVSGTFQTTFAEEPDDNTSGTITGTVNEASVTLTLTPSVPQFCPFNATLIRTSETQLSGTFAAFNCREQISGTINVTRQ